MNNEIKTFSYLAYIGPLFLVGLCSDKRNEPALRFHLNQGLVLYICEVTALFVHAILNALLGGIFLLNIIPGVLLPVIGLASFVFSLIGIFNVATDKRNPLPYIGSITLLK